MRRLMILGYRVFVLSLAIFLVTYIPYAHGQSSSISVTVSPQYGNPNAEQLTHQLCGPPGTYSAQAWEAQCKGYSVKEGESVTLGISVSGGVSPYKIDVYNNGALVTSGSANKYYTYVFPPFSQGNYSVSFIATDSQGSKSLPAIADVFVSNLSFSGTAGDAQNKSNPLSGTLTIYAENLTMQQNSSEIIGLTNSVTGGNPPITSQWLERTPTSDGLFEVVSTKNDNFTFNTKGVAAGTYQFEFKVIDSKNNDIDSNILSVEVVGSQGSSAANDSGGQPSANTSNLLDTSLGQTIMAVMIAATTTIIGLILYKRSNKKVEKTEEKVLHEIKEVKEKIDHVSYKDNDRADDNYPDDREG